MGGCAAETHHMTASRTCRACGAELSPEVRWCTRCYEPVQELSPRAAIHDRDFVGVPIHERGNIPRWTRWEKTATTFGPWGRIVATVVLFLTLIPAISMNAIVYLVTFPFFAAVAAREIWAKGWFVPEDARTRPSQPPIHEERSAPEPIAVTKVFRWTIGLAGAIAF